MPGRALWTMMGFGIALLVATPARADDSDDAAGIAIEAGVEAELPAGLGPLDLTTSLTGYRVRLSHAQLERIVELGEVAELVAELGGRELIAQAIWLVRLELEAMCVLGGHDGVELTGSWAGLPKIRPE